MTRQQLEPTVHVYVMNTPFFTEGGIYPPARQREIESCKNEEVRRAKFYVWKLLERSLAQSFCLKMESMDFELTPNGKWVSPQCHFSLTHSGSMVAVALSEAPVGVDAERADEARFTQKLAQRILTENEKTEYWGADMGARSAVLGRIWTKKEALFKCEGEGAFLPDKVDTAGGSFLSKELLCGGERYFLSVASPHAPHALFYLGEGVTIK